ncbi:unnamed protein product [Brachionus calyciflorus]|uniref:F5/8 type C domain-containing protein n=1 Tax=Brachionus calyciflorus TaxID=104777 RepID=A0A813MY96_9BILA|nr:unnamed protein product [Brachionus calyciflorus]
MLDIPLARTGAYVSFATSNDENHPASNVLDGNSSTFWVTTGLLPQSIIISFPNVVNLKKIKITIFKVQNLIIEKSMKPRAKDFDIVTEKSFKNDNHYVQESEIEFGHNFQARHLKFTISEAYDSFVGIQHILAVFG